MFFVHPVEKSRRRGEATPTRAQVAFRPRPHGARKDDLGISEYCDSETRAMLRKRNASLAPPESLLELPPELMRRLLDEDTGAHSPEDAPACRTSDVKAGRTPLTLYEPPGDAASRPLPVVVLVHGGGFMSGSRGHVDAWARELCERGGFAVASAGYRLAPERPHPDGLEDVLDAVGWCRRGPALPSGRRVDKDNVALCRRPRGDVFISAALDPAVRGAAAATSPRSRVPRRGGTAAVI